MPNSILGVSFKEETRKSVFLAVKEIWKKGGRLRIATVNPEFLVASERDPQFKNNVQKADIKVVDGFGLYALLRAQGWKGERLTGVELSEQLLTEAAKENLLVHIVLKKNGLSTVEQTEKMIRKNYPTLACRVVYAGTVLPPAALTLIATGIPDQEYGAETLESGVVMGVGGAIDFLTGAQKRAPKVLQRIGLEWLWRLWRQPKRFTRIWKAVVVFPFLVFKEKK